MSSDIDTVENVIRNFVRHGVATADGLADGTTVVSLWDPTAAEGMNEPNLFWNDSWIQIISGDMKNQRRRVTGWVQATGVLTVAPAFINPRVSLLTANSPLGDLIIDVADASVFRVGEALIWDTVTPAGELVTITVVDTVLNQLTIAGPGIVQPLGYLIANNAAISMSRRITDGTHFRLMAPTLVSLLGGIPVVDVDVIDRWARQLGQVDLARVLGAALSAGNPVISGTFDAAGNRMPAGDVDARSVHTVEATPTAIVEGQVTMTGAAQQFPADACKSITIENPIANAVVSIGHDNAVTLLNGYILRPGATVSLAIDNANRVWCIGTAPQIISYIGVT